MTVTIKDVPSKIQVAIREQQTPDHSQENET